MLVEVASAQHGFVTSAQARELGINPANIRQMAGRGTLEKRSDGLYRIPGFASTEHSECMEATLWAKERGVIVDESALVLWNLCDVNPQHICLGIPTSYRINKAGSDRYTIRKVNIDSRDIDEVSGIPTMAPFLAIKRSINFNVRGDLIEQAIETGEQLRHLTRNEAARLRVANLDRKS